MEDGIVHEEDYITTCKLLLLTNVSKHPVDVFFEESGIICSFDNLTAEQLVLSDGSNEWHRVHLLLGNTLLHWQLHCLEGMRTYLTSESVQRSLNQGWTYDRIYKGVLRVLQIHGSSRSCWSGLTLNSSLRCLTTVPCYASLARYSGSLSPVESPCTRSPPLGMSKSSLLFLLVVSTFILSRSTIRGVNPNETVCLYYSAGFLTMELSTPAWLSISSLSKFLMRDNSLLLESYWLRTYTCYGGDFKIVYFNIDSPIPWASFVPPKWCPCLSGICSFVEGPTFASISGLNWLLLDCFTVRCFNVGLTDNVFFIKVGP
jgi:hypothetical protein